MAEYFSNNTKSRADKTRADSSGAKGEGDVLIPEIVSVSESTSSSASSSSSSSNSKSKINPEVEFAKVFGGESFSSHWDSSRGSFKTFQVSKSFGPKALLLGVFAGLGALALFAVGFIAFGLIAVTLFTLSFFLRTILRPFLGSKVSAAKGRGKNFKSSGDFIRSGAASNLNAQLMEQLLKKQFSSQSSTINSRRKHG